MAVNTIIREVKKIHPEEVVLVKIGNFYHCYGKDSCIISYLLDYKLRKTKEGYYTCGFSEKCIAKVENKLMSKKINYIILDSRNNYDVDTYEDFRNLNTYMKIYEIAKKNIIIKNQIENIYSNLKNRINSNDIYEKISNINKILEG